MTEPESGWDRHAAEQRRAWRRLTYAERLRWLEQAKRFQKSALGAARKPRAGRDQSDPKGSPSEGT